MLKTVNAVNSLLGTLVSLAVVGVIAAGGWFGFKTYYGEKWAREEIAAKLAEREEQIQDLSRGIQERDGKIGLLNEDIKVKQREIARLDMANRLLKVDHRVAQLDVLSQQGSAKDGTLATNFSFVELDDRGKPLDNPRQFSVKGDTIHVDAMIVKFDDKSVEVGDPLRATSLCLFKRIYGDKQRPEEAFPVDPVGSQPVAYRGGKETSDLEREIWDKFWDIANDPKRAAELGVRSAGGEGVWHKVTPGKRYKITLRSSGGLSVLPEDLPAKTGSPTL